MEETDIQEIAPGIFRISTYLFDTMTFNQFLVTGDEPLLFHTGPRRLFQGVHEALRRVVPPELLRWITFGHLESDESGSMNEWLGVAPHSEVAHGAMGCLVSLQDLADRPPRPLHDGEVIDTGGHRLTHMDTPHVPHGWDARVLYDTTTATLLCGDLFSQAGRSPALTTGDIVGTAVAYERLFPFSSLSPTTPTVLRRLADVHPQTLALMHGPSFSGDATSALSALAAFYEERIAESVDGGGVPH